MDRKTLTIILAVILIGCFFLDYSKGGGSGYEYVFNTPGGKGVWEKYVWLLIPISGVMLLIGALNNSNYMLGRSLWSWLPLLTILFFLIRAYMRANDFSAVTATVKNFGIGLWITAVAAIILAFYNPRRR
jgi:hypothetical protein